ncbi:MAG TPA: hypothetical protein VHM24_08580 [Gemmatimonadaceae bacterium]|nr:hypothetical protein [Gemmatimonadaceae bacterium]
MAEAYIRTFGKYFQETWQEQRGEALTLAKLRASRVAFASTPYEPLPKNVHPGLRKAFGSYYLVWFTEDGDPSLLLAVAANNGDVKIDSDGQLLLPKLSGGEFRGQGIPRSQSAGAARRFMPLTPEQAVITLGQASGAKIREVPELVLLEISNAPVTAAWRLVLDRRIPIEGAPLSETQELLVTTDPTSRHTVAAADQPAGMNYPLLVVDGEGTEGRETTVYVALRPGARIRYEKATPRMGGGL